MIAVLPPDLPDETLAEIGREVEALGWRPEVSVGQEQTVLALAGSGDPAELQAALERRTDVDLIPVLTGTEYARRRARRRFTTVLASALGVVTALGILLPVARFVMPPFERLSTPNLARVATESQMAPNSARLVSFHGNPVILVRTDSDRYFALSPQCTYVGESRLEWDPERRLLVCPAHGCAYDLYGNAVDGPPYVPLVSYDVELLGAEVLLRRRG